MARVIELFPSGARSLVDVIGKRGALHTGSGLVVDVRIKDARVAYGRRDLLVVPLRGAGSAWVLADRVRIADALVEKRGQKVR
jgi:hypothetical protein